MARLLSLASTLILIYDILPSKEQCFSCVSNHMMTGNMVSIWRRRRAKEKWRRRALFVDISRMKIVFERTEKPRKPKRPKRLPSWITKRQEGALPIGEQRHTLGDIEPAHEIFMPDKLYTKKQMKSANSCGTDKFQTGE